MRQWHDNIDPASIPYEVLASELARRNARKRKTYTGGVVWAKHSSLHPGCRCAKCIAKRAAAQEATA